MYNGTIDTVASALSTQANAAKRGKYLQRAGPRSAASGPVG
jgi:hypothetical protein